MTQLALDFDGVDGSFLTCATRTTFSSTDDFSYVCWVKPDTVAPNYQFLISNASANPNPKGSALVLRFSLFDFYNEANGSPNVSSTPVTAGVWTHCVLTHRGSNNTARIYTNGVIDPNGGVSLNAWSDGVLNLEALKLGGAYVGGIDCLAGLMDEVGIYNIELDQAAVTAIYNGGLGVCGSALAAGIVYGWHLDETSSPSLSYATANDATWAGGIASVPGIVTCGGGTSVATLSGCFFGC